MTKPLARLDALDERTCLALRARLQEARYDDEILGWAESIAPGAPDAVRLPIVHWHLRKRTDPIARAALLFAYDATLGRADVDALLGASLAEALLSAGVLEHDGGGLRATVRVLPVAELLVLGDIPTRGADVVMPPGPTTLELLRLMPDTMTGSALDVGCGPGTFALAAKKRGATRAVGVDISERAVVAARISAHLSGVACEYRVGDLTAPVKGERFDLVVAQPPYVIRPPDGAAVTFLHAGPSGDEIALRLIAELPSVLAPGGHALVLFDTPIKKGEPLHARVRAALGDAPVDVAILAARGLSPDLQACGYASLEAPELGAAYAAHVARYRSHLATTGIEATSHALVLLRAAREAGAASTVSLPVARLPRGGTVVRDLWAALDLASSSDAVLEAALLRASPHARFVEERASFAPDAPITRRAVFADGAFGVDQELSDAAMALVEAVDTTPSLGAAVLRYAELCEATADEVRSQVLAFVRQALAQGVLVPSETIRKTP